MDLIEVLDALAQQQFVGSVPSFQPPSLPPSRKSISLWIHTSNRCNLACSYCYVNSESTGGLLYDSALDDLSVRLGTLVESDGLRHIQLKLGGGEPLLLFDRWAPQVARLKADLESRGARVSLQVLTNGTVVTPRILEFLNQHSVGVGLSLDGYGSQHDKTRHFHSGRGSFSVVARTLQRFKAAGILPYVTSVVVPENLAGLPGLTSFLLEHDLRFRFSLAKGRSFHVDTTVDALTSSYQLVERALPTYLHFLAHTLCDLSFDRPVVDSPCGVGRSHGSVNIQGEIHACQTQHAASPLAVLSETENLFDVLQHQSVRSSLLPISASCEECAYRYVCGGGCPAIKVAHKSPFCVIFHAVLPNILKLRGLTTLYRLAAAN